MPRKHGVKVPPAERIERRRKVEELLSVYMARQEICRRIAAEYDVSTRVVHDDVDIVLAEWTAAAPPVEQRRAQCLESLRKLYQRCLAAKDYRSAVAVQDRICRIEGLYAPVDVNVNHVVLHVDAMTTAAKRQRIAELLDKAALPVPLELAAVN